MNDTQEMLTINELTSSCCVLKSSEIPDKSSRYFDDSNTLNKNSCPFALNSSMIFYARKNRWTLSGKENLLLICLPLSMRCIVQIVRSPAKFVQNYSIDHESNVVRCLKDPLEFFSPMHSHQHCPPKCRPDTDLVVDAELMRLTIRRPNFQRYSKRPDALLCIADQVYDPFATENCKQKKFRIDDELLHIFVNKNESKQ